MAEASSQYASGTSTEPSEPCYVYQPARVDPTSTGKQRKLTVKIKKQGLIPQFKTVLPKLFDGTEEEKYVQARSAAYSRLWGEKETQLKRTLDDANAEIVENVSRFVTSTDLQNPSRQLPAGLIRAGLASSASGSMFEAVSQKIRVHEHCLVVCVHASECYNLKAALKIIIQRGTLLNNVDSDDEELLVVKEGRRLLNYDLQTLYNHVRARGIDRFVIFIQNSEALDPQVLAELVDVLWSWQNRIPFVLLFEMVISVELFQEKLARSTVRQLSGALFESQSSGEILDLLFSSAVSGKTNCSLLVGQSVSRLLLDRQTEQIGSARAFITALKYCYMMHFYNNPLSFLCSDGVVPELQKEHIDRLKGLPSFQRHVEILTGDGQESEAKKLMRDDFYLRSQLQSMLEQSRATFGNVQHALRMLLIINDATALRSNLTYSALYIKALAGELSDSSITHELIAAVRKLPSDRLLILLEKLRGLPILETAQLDSEIGFLRSEQKKSRPPLRTTIDTATDVRTTIKGQKVVLDMQKRGNDPQATAYTKLVDRIDLALVSYLAKTLVPPRDICFAEILVFDGKNQCRDALASAPRAALERALSRPHDYLACACCDVIEGQLAASQPATTLVYQLYLESGATINIQDLWLAFRAIVGPENPDDIGPKEDETLALFHRALAELRYLGMLKNNKRKADHLAKMRWKGL